MADSWCFEIISSCEFSRTGSWSLSVLGSLSHATYHLAFFLLGPLFLVTVSPSVCKVPVEHVHLKSQQRALYPLLLNLRRENQILDSSVHVIFKKLSSVVCNCPVS